MIRRYRRAPHINQELEQTYHQRLQLAMETGIGPSLFGTPAGPPYYTLMATDSSLWRLDLGNYPYMTLTSTTTGPADTVILTDIATGSTSWRFGVMFNPFGQAVISTTSIVYDPSYPTQLPIIALGSQQGFIQILSDGQPQYLLEPVGERQPQVCLRWSNDGGHTWSNEHWAGAGIAGDYKRRVIWRRLGKARDRVYEVSMTDPISWRLIDAHLTATNYDTPIPRYASQMAKMQ
jgi:hypothetical protein